jgi:hypothetical protein
MPFTATSHVAVAVKLNVHVNAHVHVNATERFLDASSVRTESTDGGVPAAAPTAQVVRPA